MPTDRGGPTEGRNERKGERESEERNEERREKKNALFNLIGPSNGSFFSFLFPFIQNHFQIKKKPDSKKIVLSSQTITLQSQGKEILSLSSL